jgi:23S rRNA (guanosine2251-2'-O)-methyltransferase
VRDRQGRSRGRGLGGEQVEGRRAVRELLVSGRRAVRELWIAEETGRSAQLEEIERLASRNRLRVSVVGRRKLDAMARTDRHQGVLARAAPLEEAALEDLCKQGREEDPFLVVVDGMSDPQNLGALLRTAECAGVTGVVLPRHRAAHVTPAVAKAAAGAIEHLEIAVVPGVPSALLRLAEHGVFSIGLEPGSDVSLFDPGLELHGPVALVLGSEGKGLGALSRRRCDLLAAIPQRGAIGSLNVAAAGAVACFELARRRAERRM